MKRLITEADIIKAYKSGNNIFEISKNDILTPLALDKIKTLGMSIANEAKNPKESFSTKKIKFAVGSDHTGFKLKSILINFLKENDIEITDVGTSKEESCDYPDFAIAVAEKVKKGEVTFGLIIDATGIPSAITANKFKGIRAATCYNEFSARSAREHNDANIIVLGAKSVGDETNKSVLSVFIKTGFLGKRHQKRLEKISLLEKRNFKE